MLHALAPLGGWPGALLAQRLFHHKTLKMSFQLVFRLTAALTQHHPLTAAVSIDGVRQIHENTGRGDYRGRGAGR
jgi:uncharacterized membrane protein YsdA (DUF1294 family)